MVCRVVVVLVMEPCVLDVLKVDELPIRRYNHPQVP